jgi:malonyl-CoA/methylmalonyl-CoA synthetase
MNANLYDIFALRFPQDRTACCIETGCGRQYSWEDMERGSARIANLLASLDLPRDARVAVQVDKSPEAVMLYLATLRAGLVYLPLNTAYRAAEIEYFLNDAEPSVVVCSPANAEWVQTLATGAGTRHVYTLDQLRDGANSGTLLDRAAACSDRFDTVERGADDLAVILYTSGTTGRSKGAMLTHGNLASNALVLRDCWQWQPDDVLLHALPLFHIHGLFVACNGALINGSKMIFLTKFDSAEIVRHLAQATVFMGVPTYYTRLLDEPGFNRDACARMRLFISGSAPLLPATFTAFRERSGHTILERYGMSETAMQTSNPYDGPRLPGSVGKPLPGVTVRTVDAEGRACAVDEIGGIEVRGPNVFKGYWRMPEKTAEEFTADGYFRTGDVGKFDANGYLWIVGRSKDLIISGGYNVYPKEVEEVIDDLDGVQESAVIGVPHADFGEAVVAVVGPVAGAAISEANIVASLKQRIANFKVPKHVHFVDELPRNTMGKVQKNLLRSRFA